MVNGTIHVNQRVRLPNKVKANRSEKLAKCGKTCVHHTSYKPGNTTRKANNIYASENGMTNVFLSRKPSRG